MLGMLTKREKDKLFYQIELEFLRMGVQHSVIMGPRPLADVREEFILDATTTRSEFQNKFFALKRARRVMEIVVNEFLQQRKLSTL
jgi:hypothetical protein